MVVDAMRVRAPESGLLEDVNVTHLLPPAHLQDGTRAERRCHEQRLESACVMATLGP